MAIRLSSPLSPLTSKCSLFPPTPKTFPSYTTILKSLALLTSLTTLYLSHTISTSLLSSTYTQHSPHSSKKHYSKQSHPNLLQIQIYTTLTPLLSTIYLATSLLYNHLVTLTLPPAHFLTKPHTPSPLPNSPKPSHSSHCLVAMIAHLTTLSFWMNCELPFPSTTSNSSSPSPSSPEFLFSTPYKLPFCADWPRVEPYLQWWRFGLGCLSVLLFGGLVLMGWWDVRRVRVERVRRKVAEEEEGRVWRRGKEGMGWGGEGGEKL